MNKHFKPTIAQNILAIIFLSTGGFFSIASLIMFILTFLMVGNILLFSTLAIVFASLGLPFLITGFIFWVYVKKQDERAMQLMERGNRVMAKVVDYRFNPMVRLNRRNPVRFTCECGNDRYISGNYWGNPEEIIGKEVSVYLDLNDPKNYYVSVI